jgi:hypothetical protein
MREGLLTFESRRGIAPRRGSYLYGRLLLTQAHEDTRCAM